MCMLCVCYVYVMCVYMLMFIFSDRKVHAWVVTTYLYLSYIHTYIYTCIHTSIYTEYEIRSSSCQTLLQIERKAMASMALIFMMQSLSVDLYSFITIETAARTTGWAP